MGIHVTYDMSHLSQSFRLLLQLRCLFWRHYSKYFFTFIELTAAVIYQIQTMTIRCLQFVKYLLQNGLKHWNRFLVMTVRKSFLTNMEPSIQNTPFWIKSKSIKYWTFVPDFRTVHRALMCQMNKINCYRLRCYVVTIVRMIELIFIIGKKLKPSN